MGENIIESRTFHHGENVNSLLGVFGMSQTILAEKINMQPAKLSRLLKEEVIDDETLNNIAMAMNTELNGDFIKKYNHDNTKQYIISGNDVKGIAESGSQNVENIVAAYQQINKYADEKTLELLLKEKDERLNDYKTQVDRFERIIELLSKKLDK